MSGRAGRGNGRGGRGGRGGRNRGRGNNYTGAGSSTKKGLCAALGDNVFDYGQKGSADQMRTTWEKLTQCVGATHGQDIRNELENKATVNIPEPTHADDVMNRHTARELMVRTGQANIQAARRTQEAMLEQAVAAGTDPEAPMKLAVLQNEIAQATFDMNQEVPIELTDSEKTQCSNAWRTYRERNANLEKNRGQVFSLIHGQCTQLLQDKMKQDTDWTATSTSNDPLTLHRLIEKTILAQTEDQCPFATVHEQELGFYSFRQETMTNAQWCERFNTKVDVGNAIGVTRQHKVLLECAAQELHNDDFDNLTAEQQLAAREDAEERHISHSFLRQSGKQHANLKVDPQNDFTTGDNRYPKTRQSTLHLLDKCSKTVVTKTTQSEGAAFVQRSGNGGKAGTGSGKDQQEDYDKKYWKDKDCFKCGEKGHPASHCPKKTNTEDDEKSLASAQSSVKKLTKEFKNMQKAFSQVNTQLAQLKEEASDLSDSDTHEEDSHFQFEQGFQFAQLDHQFEPRIRNLFKQAEPKKIKLDLREVTLLDSQSTMDLTCNKGMVAKVFKSGSSVRLRSNGGSMLVTHKAKMPGYHKNVWFSKKAIANIVALSNLIKQYRVTCDSDDLMFVVHRESENKPNVEFRMHESGLHCCDPREHEHIAFVTAVLGNKEGFTKRQIRNAEIARALYTALIYPSTNDYKWVIRSNQIRNCPVTVQDVDVAFKIWGKNIPALKGKTTREKPNVVARDLVKVPTKLLNLHNEVFLTADVFFVNKIPFFLTLSRKTCFTAVNHLANRKVPEIFKAFKEIHQCCLQRGFRITEVHADGEFEPLKPLIESLAGGPAVNLASSDEHVPEIERRIRVVKERCRAVRHGLPFQRIPKLLTTCIVFNVVKMLNFFPTKGGVSETLSPKTIVSGETLDYKKHLRMPIGQRCQVHEEENPRNSQLARTRGAISLGPSGNLQGGYKFMALNTGKKITRRSWDVIPMPDTVIARVNVLGNDQPEQLVFADRKGRPIGDVEIPGVPPDDVDDAKIIQLPGVDADTQEAPAFDDDVELPGVDMDGQEDPPEIQIDDLDAPEPDPAPIEVDQAPAEVAVETVDEVEVQDVAAPAVEPAAAAEAPAAEGPRRSTRARSAPKSCTPSMTGSRHSHAAAQLEHQGVLNPDAHVFVQEDFYQAEPDTVAAIMTQLSLKAGLKKWGDKAFEAAHNEMKQLHLRDTFKPKHARELAHLQRQMILESHLFLKEKRTGEIKGRTVAGGNKQRDCISKEDASSPTVATESVLLTCIVDAEEGRDVAVVDIPNAFIQTRVQDEKDMAYIRIRGVLVDVLVDIAPDVREPCVTVDKKGNKQLIVQCLNAMCGTMVASLLYYRKFVKSLTDIGFELNPRDPCVANKMIDGKQMTACFHVDDCKISHRKRQAVDRIVKCLRKEYESIFEDGSGKMKVSRGKIHAYLGMTLDYSAQGQVRISMFDCVEEILTAFDKAEPKGGGTKSDAAPDNLFKVNEDCEKLRSSKAVEFHNLVAKTLHATKRARPDTCTAIAFLTTRVREPDKDDWAKLVHLMKCIRGTRKLPLILSADGSGILKWWVDASFAVHPNMRGHSGGGLSLGRGFPIVGSTKQKLNGRSSTEIEIIGADDFMPAMCWTRYFLEAQGYGVKDNILCQDNKSSILLEKNGKMSSGKRTKHINIRYFFVTDRASEGELSIEWCPTADVVADFATKPLHGALFRKFRDQIMGVVPMNDPSAGKKKPMQLGKVVSDKKKPRKGKKSLVLQKAVPQECVGDSFKKERRTGGIGKPS